MTSINENVGNIDTHTSYTESGSADAFLASLVESSDDGIIGKTLDGIITSWNKAAEKIFGYTTDEILGRPISIIVPRDGQNEFNSIMEKIRKDHRIEHFETRRVRKDGKTINVSVTLSPIKNKDGKIIGVSTIVRNITEEKKRDQERIKLAAIVESSEDAILGMSLDGTVNSWNMGAVKMFGYSEKEIIGESVKLIYPSDRIDELSIIVQKLSSGARIEHFETERKRKDGTLIDVSLSISPIKDERGNVEGIAKIIRDISGQKRSSVYARSLIEASLDPLVTINTEGKITDVNEATVKITGVTREMLIGSDFSNYFTEPEEAREGYERVFKEGFVTDYPLSIKSSSGQITDVLYNASVYKNDKGKVLGVFAAARNASRVKQKDEFSTMITHELKTPLSPILGYCKMLETSLLGKLSGEQIEAIMVIKKNALMLEALINDIMDARKLDMDKMKFNFTDVSMKGFINNLDSTYHKVLQEKRINFVTNLSDADIIIKTDENRLRQVLDNIISNSIKFVKGNNDLIHIMCTKSNDKIFLNIKDSGIGVPIEKQKDLFKKFYQADTSDRRAHRGTGLGLAISKGIMEKLGGTISLESDGKTGTTVYLTLPIRR